MFTKRIILAAAVIVAMLSLLTGCHTKPSKEFRKARIAFRAMEGLAKDRFYTGADWDNVLTLLDRVHKDRTDDFEKATALKKTITKGRDRYKRHLQEEAARKRREDRAAQRARRRRELEADRRRRARIHFATPKGECPVGLHNDGGGQCIFEERSCGVGFEWMEKRKSCVPAN